MLDKTVFFMHVVRYGSISEAAKAFHITVATGCRWLKELETKLNVPLLISSTRKSQPTEAGMLLYERFNKVYLDIQDIYKEIEMFNNTDSGIITIASTPLFSRYFLSKIVGEYLFISPQVSFHIEETAWVDEKKKDVDFYIRAGATYRGHMEPDSQLIKKILFHYPLVVCCSPGYIASYGEPVSPEELKYHNCIYTSTLVGGNRWQFEMDGDITAIEIAKTVEIENSEFLKEVALAGGGIACLPLPLVKKELENGELISILNAYMKSKFEISLWFRSLK
ncbi:LysR family transcriptional regulator, partial [Salmonella enterica]|nr:LysR family transcriptional regulator [Salmonella enterica]